MLLLAVLGGSVYAINGQMGVISSPSTQGLGFTWKNGIANDSVLNLGVSLGSTFGVNGAYHFTLLDAPIADIDWLYWNVEVGPFAGILLGNDMYFSAGAEALVGLSFYLAPLFDANIPLEVFVQGGPRLGVMFGTNVDVGIIPNYFDWAAGIRWVF